MTDSLYAQRYRLVEALPPGRALAVHRALDSQGRTVRITVVRPYDADAFQRQMGAVSSARHLDLPAIFDVGRDGLDCYVVTEDVEGADALALVARGALPVSDASMLGAQAAAGLAALHAQGVVHGGIGPEQVVRTADGTVKLTGAGMAGGYPQVDLRPGAPAAGAHPSRCTSPPPASAGSAWSSSTPSSCRTCSGRFSTAPPTWAGPRRNRPATP